MSPYQRIANLSSCASESFKRNQPVTSSLVLDRTILCQLEMLYKGQREIQDELRMIREEKGKAEEIILQRFKE